MVSSDPKMRFTVDELVGRMPDRLRWRLIEGELVMMSPAGGRHGQISLRIAVILDQYVQETKAGIALGAETGFVIARSPDTMLAPDVSYLTPERTHLVTDQFIEGAPDLAVEVVSPSESQNAAMEKAQRWLTHGTRMVWLVWPKTHSVTLLRADADDVILHDGDTIDGIDFMPGFSCSVGAFFS